MRRNKFNFKAHNNSTSKAIKADNTIITSLILFLLSSPIVGGAAAQLQYPQYLPFINTDHFTSYEYTSPQSYGERIPNQFIVVLKNTVSEEVPYYLANNVAVSTGAQVLDIYDSAAIKGFTTVLPNQQALDMILNDPSTAYVEQDQVVYATQIQQPALQQELYSLQRYQQLERGEEENEIQSQLGSHGGQIIPTGIKRVLQPSSSFSEAGAAFNYGSINNNVDVNVDIAILDTGIDLGHPDLNIYREVTFVSGTATADDDSGHGTHVAGIAAAKDNNFGVVGMAPGARLWAIKVLNSQGMGMLSDIIEGIDYIAKNAKEIDVVNMSFGCDYCISIALENAIQNAVSSGSVTFVSAAGNSHIDASSSSLTNSRNVLPISAIVDSDGRCGGLGPSSNFGADDTFASFSNYGPTIAMAAPGVDIYSTYKDGEYAIMSGTSMSSAHVAGAVGLIKGLLFPATVLSSYDLKNILFGMGSTPNNAACESDNSYSYRGFDSPTATQVSLLNGANNKDRGYFYGDPDGINEPLLFVESASNNVNVPQYSNNIPFYEQPSSAIQMLVPQPQPPPSSIESQIPEYHSSPADSSFQLNLPVSPQQQNPNIFMMMSSLSENNDLPTFSSSQQMPLEHSPQSLSSFLPLALSFPATSRISSDTITRASPTSISPSHTSPDTVLPETFISSATTLSNNKSNDNSNIQNNATTQANTIAFTFAGQDNSAISGFECSLDNDSTLQQQELKPFSCANKVIINNVLAGNHSFQVTALDSSGNRDQTPAIFTWNVITRSNSSIGNGSTVTGR